MDRKWIFIITVLVLFIAIGATKIYVSGNKADSVSSDELPAIMSNSIASLYFSTTADQDMNRDGMSFVVFIDAKGDTRLWEMNGLELGTIHEADNTFFMEDRNHVYIVERDAIKEFKADIEEHTGEITGYKDGKFYSVYNSGFADDGTYASNLRIGDSSGFQTAKIPHYMYMSGIGEDEISFVAGDEETMSLFSTPLQKDVEVNEIVTLGEIGDRLGLSPILHENGYYYMLISDTQKLTGDLYRINEETKKIDVFPFLTYKDLDNYRVRVPYNLRNAATIDNGIFHYVDGAGDVHRFDFTKEQPLPMFSLEGASTGSLKMNEQTYFKDGNLYFFRYNKPTNAFAIDTYDLQSGKRIAELPVNGLDEMFEHSNSKKKNVSSYDFLVR